MLAFELGKITFCILLVEDCNRTRRKTQCYSVSLYQGTVLPKLKGTAHGVVAQYTCPQRSHKVGCFCSQDPLYGNEFPVVFCLQGPLKNASPKP